jgi:hypothetical protein
MPCNFVWVQTMNCQVNDLLTQQAADILQLGLNRQAPEGVSYSVETGCDVEGKYLWVTQKNQAGESAFSSIHADNTLRGDPQLNALIGSLVPRWRARVLQAKIKDLMAVSHTIKREDWTNGMTLTVKV